MCLLIVLKFRRKRKLFCDILHGFHAVIKRKRVFARFHNAPFKVLVKLFSDNNKKQIDVNAIREMK